MAMFIITDRHDHFSQSLLALGGSPATIFPKLLMLMLMLILTTKSYTGGAFHRPLGGIFSFWDRNAFDGVCKNVLEL